MKLLALLLSLVSLLTTAGASTPPPATHTKAQKKPASLAKRYELWYDKPVPELPIVSKDYLNVARLVEATPVDSAWENLSLPIGNGYLGASLFGRTVTERVQLTENSMASKSLYGGIGLTSFAELSLDIGHRTPQNYRRSLSLNNAVASVSYEQDDVRYEREYFASYPDKVLVIHLRANKRGKISFTLRPQDPYQRPFGTSMGNGRAGKVTAVAGLATLSGSLEATNLLYEGQFKVIPTGGKMRTQQDARGENGTITVSNADSATIIVAVGTSYQLNSRVFEASYQDKVKGNPPPHERVSIIMAAASAKTYSQLLAAHQADFTRLFNRAAIDFGSKVPALTTDKLLARYKEGMFDSYLEELYFNYGRYLLICSSRPGTLPPNLQGIWNQYEIAPWTGGYWHNINIQMNYWPVFTTNLAELFTSFVDYNAGYRKATQNVATSYIKKYNPTALASDGDNGWTIGTGANAYSISAPGGHSGPGTGALTTKMFWDYYEFTGDKQILRDVSYPAILGMAKFLSKTVIEKDGFLLAFPSSSPEQRSKVDQLHYQTIGSTFDQAMIYENHRDALKAAKVLGDDNAMLPVLQAQLTKLDPIHIGWSGQIKEYREEKYYGDLVMDPKHRHISHLLGLYPGTVISTLTPAWLDAARETLERRGNKTTGWAIANRMNCWARIKDGEQAYQAFQVLLTTRTLDNLWNSHPPFQIDGNFGATAAIAEMLVQSHEGYIDLLPALPAAWNAGSFQGLVARGNFEVSARWSNAKVDTVRVRANIGGALTLHYPGINEAIVTDGKSQVINVDMTRRDFISFRTSAGSEYQLTKLPTVSKVAAPSDLTAKLQADGRVQLRWTKSADAVAYKVYGHFKEDAPDYHLVAADVKALAYLYKGTELQAEKHGLFRVTAIDKQGRESQGLRVTVEMP